MKGVHYQGVLEKHLGQMWINIILGEKPCCMQLKCIRSIENMA
jgi:hypothetical protein